MMDFIGMSGELSIDADGKKVGEAFLRITFDCLEINKFSKCSASEKSWKDALEISPGIF